MGRETGAVLLEALLVAVVLGVGLLGLLGLEQATLRGRQGTWERMGALALAMSALEETGLSRLEPGASKAWSRPLGAGTRPFYQVTVTGQGGGGVAVRVTWDSAGSGPAPLEVTLALGSEVTLALGPEV